MPASAKLWLDCGRQKTVTDELGRREFGYTGNRLVTEAIDGLYDLTLTRRYEDTGQGGTVNGRPIGFCVGTDCDNSDYRVDYHYDPASGRLNRIQGPGLPAYGAVYSPAASSEFVEYLRYQSDASTTLASVQRHYEPHRDLVDFVENRTSPAPADPVSRYAYVNGTVNRRTRLVCSGAAFAQAHNWHWLYNGRGELESAERRTGISGGVLMTPGDYDYRYDPIGNRESFQLDGAIATTYTTNNLNQYEATADPAESFGHDLDGNLEQDGTFDYAWDGENRLVSVTSRIDLGASATEYDENDVKVEFAYDYMGRRVEKQVSTWQSGGWQLETEQLFVYDRWNVILVLDASEQPPTIATKYTWGLDLSGWAKTARVPGIHGAGGIGGLLAAEETARSGSPAYWFLYDANGNVGDVLNANGQTRTAHYQYDAYGNTTLAQGVDSSGYVDVNAFSFSTKWLDRDIGVSYYGNRYRRERWLSRDPVGERGGDNLYAFVQNAPTNRIDPDGRIPLSCALCIGSVGAEVVGAVAGCMSGCIQYSDGATQCTMECWAAYAKDRMDCSNYYNWFKNVVQAGSCIACGIALTAPEDCNDDKCFEKYKIKCPCTTLEMPGNMPYHRKTCLCTCPDGTFEHVVPPPGKPCPSEIDKGLPKID